jgi:hypothetical protein
VLIDHLQQNWGLAKIESGKKNPPSDLRDLNASTPSFALPRARTHTPQATAFSVNSHTQPHQREGMRGGATHEEVINDQGKGQYPQAPHCPCRQAS